MIIHNRLPELVTCLKEWPTLPSEEEFNKKYLSKLKPLLQPMLDDFGARFHGTFYQVLEGLNWKTYRDETLAIDPHKEELRLKKHIAGVENLLAVKLGGEAVLFGAFTMMDGYARFDQGTHRVFLGVDESHGRGAYLDVLVSHELTHVARESQESVWSGWGLSLNMTHDQFTENQPVVEHLMNEGFSCVVSELLNPNEPKWNYVYQDQESLAHVLSHGPAVDRKVHAELKNPDGDYGSLYDINQYSPPVPRFAHYVWAWQWVKRLLKTQAQNDPKKLLALCSKDLVQDALAFRLEKIE